MYFSVWFYVMPYKVVDDSASSFLYLLLKTLKDYAVRKKIFYMVNYNVFMVYSAPIGLYFCGIKEEHYI